MAIKGKAASKKKVTPKAKAKLGTKGAAKPTKKLSAKAKQKPAVKTRKAVSKAATKVTATKKIKAAAPKKTADGKTPLKNQPTGLWKFLELKEAQRKAHEAERAGSHWNENRNAGAGKHQGFSRFAGPRRRAA